MKKFRVHLLTSAYVWEDIEAASEEDAIGEVIFANHRLVGNVQDSDPMAHMVAEEIEETEG